MRIFRWLAKSILSAFLWLIGAMLVLFLLSRCQSQTNSEPEVAKPVVDLSRPLQTDALALVCPKSLLLSGMMDRRQTGVLEQVRDLYSSLWGVERKAQALGCEQWRAGIQIYNVERLGAYVVFTTSQHADDRYFFTTPVHLVNVSSDGRLPSPAIARSQDLVGGSDGPTDSGFALAAKQCHKEGDLVQISGYVSDEDLTMADDTVSKVKILTADIPVCVRSSPEFGSAESRLTTRFQLIGRGQPSSGAGSIKGRLTTDNITQYYAVPEAIEVTSASDDVSLPQ